MLPKSRGRPGLQHAGLHPPPRHALADTPLVLTLCPQPAIVPPRLPEAVDPDCTKQRRLQRITPHHALLGRLAGGLLGPLLAVQVEGSWHTLFQPDFAAKASGKGLELGSATKKHRKSEPATPNVVTPEDIEAAKAFMSRQAKPKK